MEKKSKNTSTKKSNVSKIKNKSNVKKDVKKDVKKGKSSKTKGNSTKFAAIAIVVLLAVVAVSFNFNRFVSDDDVAATIGDDVISMDELNERYGLMFFLNGYPEAYEKLITKESFLDQMINEELLLNAAAAEDISVSGSEVKEAAAELIGNSPVTMEEFELQLDEAGFSMYAFEEYYADQLIISKLLEGLFSDIEISEEEVKVYYDENPTQYNAPSGTIRLRHILVATEEEAKSVLEQLKDGNDFGDLAEEKSTCPSASSGGVLGFVSKGQMVLEFEKAAFKLNVNQISGVVETEFGYHVIKRDPDKVPFEEAEEYIISFLETEKQKETLDNYLAELSDSLNIVNNLKVPDAVEMVEEVAAEESEVDSLESDLEEDLSDESESSCFSEYGLSSDTVIFFHTSSCPHCMKMMSVVKELEEEGYDFQWAEYGSADAEVVTACFKDVLQGGVPEFICAGSKNFKMGEMSKENLKEFADNCR